MKRLVLTFDDGPDPVYTPKLLDVLKCEDIKATFFVVAENAARYPEMIDRMKKEGHMIALHSLEHRHALLCSCRYMKHDFEKSMGILQTLGCNIRFYRPPWGARNLFTNRFVKKHKLHLVLWDVMVGDWKVNEPDILVGRMIRKVYDGAVICLHDGSEKYGGAKGAAFNTIKALTELIPGLKKEGYEFITVEELYNHE